jgi:hypothetical protein
VAESSIPLSELSIPPSQVFYNMPDGYMRGRSSDDNNVRGKLGTSEVSGVLGRRDTSGCRPFLVATPKDAGSL